MVDLQPAGLRLRMRVDMPRDGRANRLTILRELARRERDHEPPPTLRELAALTGLTESGAEHHVKRMVRVGWLFRGRGARWLVLTDEGRRHLS